MFTVCGQCPSLHDRSCLLYAGSARHSTTGDVYCMRAVPVTPRWRVKLQGPALAGALSKVLGGALAMPWNLTAQYERNLTEVFQKLTTILTTYMTLPKTREADRNFSNIYIYIYKKTVINQARGMISSNLSTDCYNTAVIWKGNQKSMQTKNVGKKYYKGMSDS